MNKSLQDLHPVEFIFVCILFIAATILNLCTPSNPTEAKRPSKEPSGSKIGTNATPNTKVSRPRSRSTKSGTSTVDQKKEAGPSLVVTPSKPSASSRKPKPSGFSTNSTRSTTVKTTRTISTTSA